MMPGCMSHNLQAGVGAVRECCVMRVDGGGITGPQAGVYTAQGMGGQRGG